MSDTPLPPAPASAAPVSRAWARALARRGAWWVPLMLSALFTLSVAVWLQLSDHADVESRQRQLITDSLSLESRISDRVAEEQLQLDAFARTVEQLVARFYSTQPDGMGLAICRSIIEAHHGTLDAVASLLGGARFSFTLPVANAPAVVDASRDGADGAGALPPSSPAMATSR